MMSAPFHLYCPDLLIADGCLQPGKGLLVDARGFVAGYHAPDTVPIETTIRRLPGKALFPGLANAHSHTFQRLFRGLAETRSKGGDSFWTWREQMYKAASLVSPDDVYDVARATFLEMVLAGITVVGEFHYLHNDRNGQAYSDPNWMSRMVIAAAQSVSLRICLLRSAYTRAGFGLPPHPGQKRFYEDPEAYLRNLDELAKSYLDVAHVSIGAAPHSIRAVPLEQISAISAFAQTHGNLPVHLHVSEQVGENEASIVEYGATPIQLLQQSRILGRRTTLIHAIHLTEREFSQVASSGATICSCPTTERNLGDGIFPADIAARQGIPIAFGTDSQAQIDILEDARQLEYHLRLRDQKRSILDESGMATPGQTTGLGLFKAASSNGYTALGLAGGTLAIGEPADFITVDLNDLSVLGLSNSSICAEAITLQTIFAQAKSAICDVAVQGRMILEERQHPQMEEIRMRYLAVHKRYLDCAS